MRLPILSVALFVAALLSSYGSLRLSAAEPAAPAATRPSIVLIVADDLGYGELGCYGGRQIPTPNIDSLARNGVRLTSGYVSCPVCSPTRAGLVTGRYQQRFGHEFNGGGSPQVQFGLPLSETTIADRLKAAGYRTGMVGKWHLGNGPEYQPQRRGFEEYFGFLGGAHPYFSRREADGARQNVREEAEATPKAKRRAAARAAAPRGAVLRGTEPVLETEYLTDALTREAVGYIKRHAKEPFFLYLTYNAVHSPLEAPPKYLDRFANITDLKRKTFAAMLSALDDGVGAVLAALREAAIEKDTLVAFVSDNGGPTPSTTSGNGPLRGFKAQVLEGGIRVPFIIQWPARIPGGKTFDAPAITLDLLPTALAAAGAKLPSEAKVDGVDLLPFLTGSSTGAPHEALFWRFGAQAAVRKGSWKLVRQRQGGDWQLYDLAADVGESKDLAKEKAEVAKGLQAAWEAWDKELAKPLWGPGGVRPSAEQRKAERQEARKRPAEKKQAERKQAERKQAERKQAERKQAEKQEAK